MTNLFVLFCSAQDDVSTDMNCLVNMHEWPNFDETIRLNFGKYFHNNYSLVGGAPEAYGSRVCVCVCVCVCVTLFC